MTFCMKKGFLLIFLCCIAACIEKQHKTEKESIPAKVPPALSVITEILASPVKQQISGTCWAYFTVSFYVMLHKDGLLQTTKEKIEAINQNYS